MNKKIIWEIIKLVILYAGTFIVGLMLFMIAISMIIGPETLN